MNDVVEACDAALGMVKATVAVRRPKRKLAIRISRIKAYGVIGLEELPEDCRVGTWYCREMCL